MKKLLLPLLTLALLATSCGKDEIIEQNYYNVVDGDYVYSGTLTVDQNSNAWVREREDINDSTYRTISFYCEWTPQIEDSEKGDIDLIDYNMMNYSFVIVYWLNGNFNVPLPKEFYYKDIRNGLEHKAKFGYTISKGVIRVTCESLDNDWNALYNYLNETTLNFRFACMLYMGN